MMTMMVIRLRLGVRNRSRNEVFDLEIKVKIAPAPSWFSDIKNRREISYSTSHMHSLLVTHTQATLYMCNKKLGFAVVASYFGPMP